MHLCPSVYLGITHTVMLDVQEALVPYTQVSDRKEAGTRRCFLRTESYRNQGIIYGNEDASMFESIVIGLHMLK